MDNSYRGSLPEVWAGPECSIVRVGDQYRDQLVETGHYQRPSDIDRLASLNIKKVRYPVLWERHQPGIDGQIDWTYTAGRLEQFKHHNIEVIAGLLHHGSGPWFTSLDDELFPELFACYAGEVAARFPTINYYTPINEPLTTARFSGLYGFWYPHHQSELSFFRMLINQLRATVLAMQEIRKVNPRAQLVQTEDLGEIQGSANLQYQAEFENERKWLTCDFLCGKVRPSHFFWPYLLQLGIPEEQLAFFIEHPCPPDTMGFNYYLTSERYLDENIENYPEDKTGGNGIHRYADTELVRTGKLQGLYSLLKQAYNRYGLPLAITECHLNCTREEQLRWVKYCWQSMLQLREENIPVQALTIWSVFGSCDWDSLLTLNNHNYETGCYDVEEAVPRPTAVAGLVKGLSRNELNHHPLVEGQGWWENKATLHTGQSTVKPLLIIGTGSTLAKLLIQICDQRSIPFCLLVEDHIAGDAGFAVSIQAWNPWAVIDTGSQRPERKEIMQAIESFCQSNELPLMTISVLEKGLKEAKSELGYAESINEWFMEGGNRKNVRLSNRNSWQHLKIQVMENEEDRELMIPAFLTVSMHKGLDLFIDGERGTWDIELDDRAKLVARPSSVDQLTVGMDTPEKESWMTRGYVYNRPAKKANGQETKYIRVATEQN